MKSFEQDFFMLLDKLKEGKPFSFSKYADGEYAILRNQKITNCDNWTFDPKIDGKYQQELLDSFKYNEDGYYVGISCPCCVPKDHVDWMRKNVTIPLNNLTWANIFVNGNYNKFKEHFIPEFLNHEIVFVGNEKATINKLPFKVEEHIKVTGIAWKDNFDLVEDVENRFKDYNNKVFLFSAGPLGNMLAAKIWKYNKNNIYMDVGSTLNPWLVGNNRGFLRGALTLNKICVW